MAGNKEARAMRVLGLGMGLAVLIAVLFLIGKFVVLPIWHKAQVDATSASVHYDHEITLCEDSFAGYAVTRSDQFRRELGSHEIGLKIVDDGADYLGRAKNLRDGDCTFAVMTVDADLVTGAQLGNDFPGTIVLVLDQSVGADGIVAFKDAIPNVQALDRADARIVATPDSPSETLALHMKAAMLPQLTGKKWLIEADGAEDVLSMMRRDDKDLPRAYALWEPELSKALELNGTHLIYDSSQTDGVIVDVLTVNRDYAASNPDRVRQVLESYLRALHHYETQQGGMVQLVLNDAQQQGSPLTGTQASRIVAGIQWTNTLENYAHFGLLPSHQAGGVRSLDEIIDSIASILVRTHKLDQHPAEGQTHTMWFDRPLEQMRANNFHPGSGGELEAIRGAAELEELQPDQWTSLIVVGDLDARTIGFRRGNSGLTTQGTRDVDEIAGQLKTWPNYYITVVGTTAGGGDAEANRVLELQRAEAVVDRLSYQGISKNRMRPLDATSAGVTTDGQNVRFILAQQAY